MTVPGRARRQLLPLHAMTMAPVRSMQVAGEEMDSGERGYAAQRSTGNDTWWDERLKPNGSDPTGGGQTAAVRRRMDVMNGRPPSASPSGGLPGNGRQSKNQKSLTMKSIEECGMFAFCRVNSN